MSDHEQKLAIHCEVDGQKTEGFALRRDLEKHERIGRAARMFGILFGVAFFTIFIPVLHFILPPLFLLAGVVFATTTYLEKAEILRGEIACPNCAKLIIFQREAEEWPKIQRCDGCSYTLTIVPN